MPKHDLSDIEWWCDKITTITDVGWGEADEDKRMGKVFSRQIGKWAIHALRCLAQTPLRKVAAQDLNALSQQLSVPTKYTMRSLAVLDRLGLSIMEFDDKTKTIEVRLRQPGERSSRKRKSIPAKFRQRLWELEGKQCGQCGLRLNLSAMRIDHIVPFSLLGADHPGNWGALCHACNRDKWHNFDRYGLKYHRGQRVARGIGVRLKNGALWPLINGKLHTEVREQWMTEMEQSTL